MKKFALFDIDRTLADGSIGVEFARFLVKQRLFPRGEFTIIERAIRLNNQGKMSYAKRGEIIIKAWARGFKGWREKDLRKAAQRFFSEEYCQRMYLGSLELISYLKNKGYFIAGISRAFEEVLTPLSDHLKLSGVVGTRFEYKNGVCTGKLSNKMWKSKAKQNAIMTLFKEENLTTYNSMAFGDTEDDYYMLEVVQHPISVNANKNLEKIANQKHWPIYHNLRLLLDDLQSGKLVARKGWFEHYSRKYDRILMNDKMFAESIENDRLFIAIVNKHAKKAARILEAGCGLGRTAIALSNAGYRVTAIDKEGDILRAAKINCFNYAPAVKLELVDFFEIDERFKPRSFDAVTHEGVLEHFTDNQIKVILNKQLKVAPVIIFSVPIKSKRNDKYFESDAVGHRNLWTKNEWVQFLSNNYSLKQTSTTNALRKDDLIIVLSKRN